MKNILLVFPRKIPNSVGVKDLVNLLGVIHVYGHICHENPRTFPVNSYALLWADALLGKSTVADGKIVRTIGIVRARFKIGMMNLGYNIRRLVQLERMAAAPA